MNLYKVVVNEDGPISSEKIYLPHYDGARTATPSGNRLAKWITVYADSEQESMKIAHKVIADFSRLLKVA